ncbi:MULTISPECIES: ATP-dependent zinc protease [unclassified Vibrio]|uniref:ATP-dependent zinc protease n=1 Tax=Vibrio sp. HB236076 TaxID=3232307 RepID=A0AB39HFH6_9VIBR|nr:ATP-dependent zinc protease [Vibrio sp. HB161653]MDP5252965.1 ATP-dependent zinc protease [Vibrio sp. HB161653]
MIQGKWFLTVLMTSALAACATPGSDTAKPASQASAEKDRQEVTLEEKKTSSGKLILGSKEKVWVTKIDQTLDSRVDTGATTSSISAVNIQDFERDGKDWVKFQIDHDDVSSKVIEMPVKRWVKIRQASSDKPDRRPIVEMEITIGDTTQLTQFTLTDRNHLSYPLLLGRSFFKDVAVVDVAKTYIQGEPRVESLAKN